MRRWSWMVAALALAASSVVGCTQDKGAGGFVGSGPEPEAVAPDEPVDDVAVTSDPTVAPDPDDPGSACDRLRTAPVTVTPTSADLVGLARAASLPRIPDDAVPPPLVTAREDFVVPADYLAGSNVPDKAARAAVMDRTGFSGGTDLMYLQDPWEHGVKVMDFADATGAVEYLRAHLTNACSTAVESSLLPSGDGIIYRASTDLVVVVFVMGRSEVTLLLCSCLGGDRLALGEAWHDRMVAELGSGPGSSVV